MADIVSLQDKYDKLEKELNEIKEEIKKNEPLFKEGQKVMLKENLFIVKVKKVKHHRFKENEYEIYYTTENNTKDYSCYNGFDYSFWVKESEIDVIPFDRQKLVWEAYLNYYYKYRSLVKELNNEVNIVCSGRRNK